MENYITAADLEHFQPCLYYTFKETLTEDSNIHTHDHPQIVYAYSGKGMYYVDGTTYDIESGDMIIVNPGIEHGHIFSNPDDPAVLLIVGYSFNFQEKEKNGFYLPDNTPLIHTSVTFRTALIKNANTMLFENSNHFPGRTVMLNSCLTQILVLLYRELNQTNEQPISYDLENYNKAYLVKQIETYLATHYYEKITLDQIAQNMYLSPVYISKIFKEETGESPINYLINIRLEKAKELLTPDNIDSIKSIANQVGYEDVYHFSKLFKKYYGISPLYYKKQIESEMENESKNS